MTKGGDETKYVWDGYNIVGELSSATTNYNVWGLDLSQSLQGAGGVGGLLVVVEEGSLSVALYDANGNITEYVDDPVATVAHYEYSPFGKIVASVGTKKDDFTHRFSTKTFDGDTGQVEYPYRKYIVDLARWGRRDPLG